MRLLRLRRLLDVDTDNWAAWLAATTAEESPASNTAPPSVLCDPGWWSGCGTVGAPEDGPPGA